MRLAEREGPEGPVRRAAPVLAVVAVLVASAGPGAVAVPVRRRPGLL